MKVLVIKQCIVAQWFKTRHPALWSGGLGSIPARRQISQKVLRNIQLTKLSDSG